MSDNTLRTRDPQIAAYNRRSDALPDARLSPADFSTEVRGLQEQFRNLTPAQQRTYRYNAAENLRRTATERGDARTLYFLDQGFFPNGPFSMPARNIDTGNNATPAQARALNAGAPAPGTNR